MSVTSIANTLTINFSVVFNWQWQIANSSESMYSVEQTVLMYSGPSILRPPIGPRKFGLILQVVLK